MKVRKAMNADQKAILKLYNDAINFISNYNSPQWQKDGPSVETLLNDLAKEELYVLTKDQEVIGVVTLVNFEKTYEVIKGKWLNDDSYVAIHRIVISNDYLGKGLANYFLKFIEHNLKAKNIKVDTHELNIPMQKFLIKNGFKYCGIITLDTKEDNQRLAFQKIV